jgi:DHA1 family bicyclomycin/chloramphenicol resistance-like MFS transporter
MSQAALAALLLGLLSLQGSPPFYLVLAAFGLSVSTMGFTGANATSLALRSHKERAGLAAGMFGFFAFGFAALSAPISGALFGASLSGVLALMAIFLLSASATVLIGLRRKTAAVIDD